MGERSQIYVKVNNGLQIANYYHWNYGDRMVSRARYGIEWTLEYIEHPFALHRGDNHFESFRRIWDVNFDYKDITISRDMIEEFGDYDMKKDFRSFVGGTNNNDGILLVSVDTVRKKIKYCFVDSDLEKPMNAKEYMDWNAEGWNKKDYQYLSDEEKKNCRANIRAIGKMAAVMTKEELDKFLERA